MLSDQKEVVRLGEDEFVDQFLQSEAMERATLIAQKFANMARASNAEEINAVTTSATREAANQGEFLRRLNDEAQLDVNVISGREEARLIYLGVSSGFSIGDEQSLFIDIGGGSTEVILDIQTHHDPQLELWGVQNHKAAFEKLFKRKLVIEYGAEHSHDSGD